MEFRDLRMQYEMNRDPIDHAIYNIIREGSFIGGKAVTELEDRLAHYTGTRYCVSCANGTDALLLALMAWGIGKGDAVFVPDFTFFATAEAVANCGATPVFVDVEKETFNIDCNSLVYAIEQVQKEGKLIPKVIIPVDLFGLPADFPALVSIAEKFNMHILEDGAQGFGGRIGDKRACSFGHIATTSFFPAKPLGCYGDGGAIFTDDAKIEEIVTSLKVHGKGVDKYDNVRIGMNSRLDTLQAAVLLKKLDVFQEKELDAVNQVAIWYQEKLHDIVKIPVIPDGFYSSWAQYTILLKDSQIRAKLQENLKSKGIPTMIYYKKPLHLQTAFSQMGVFYQCDVTEELSRKVLSLPMHPYLTKKDVYYVCDCLISALAEWDYIDVKEV